MVKHDRFKFSTIILQTWDEHMKFMTSMKINSFAIKHCLKIVKTPTHSHSHTHTQTHKKNKDKMHLEAFINFTALYSFTKKGGGVRTALIN